MIDAPGSLSRFLIVAVLLAWPVGIGLWLLLRHLAERRQQRLENPDSLTTTELLDELEHGFIPRQKLGFRTTGEYLPFLLERIRETIDLGITEDQAAALLDRQAHSKPGVTRRAMFTVECEGITSDLLLVWTRDPADRIQLEVTAVPPIARALRDFRKTIPKTRRVAGGRNRG
jgi:hypothetical protein